MTLIYEISNLNIPLDKDEENQRIDVYLDGAATFMSLPKLSSPTYALIC